MREFSAHVIQEGNSNESIIGAFILNRPTTIALCDVVRFGYVACITTSLIFLHSSDDGKYGS